MTTLESLAAAMFPAITHTPEDYEAMYPPRALKEGARVTAIAPSPTGICISACFSPPWSTG